MLSEVISRDGIITCRGALLDRRCAKIQRVCKSSLAAEGHAAVTSPDQALWAQALLREIVTDAYEIRHISPPSEFPLPVPLGPSPTDDDAQWKCRENNSKRLIFSSTCRSCDVSVPTSTLALAAAEWNHQQSAGKLSPPALLFRPQFLTD